MEHGRKIPWPERDQQRHPGRRPRRRPGLDRGARRPAAQLRRPAGGQRAGEVDDLADADRPRARRPARARRDGVLRRRQPVLALRRPARPLGGAGAARPPGDGAARRGDPRDRAPERHPRRPGRPGRPGRQPLPARHPRLDRDRGPPALLGPRQGLLRLGRAAGRRRAPRGPDREHDHRPRRAAPRRPARAHARLGPDRRRARGRADRRRRTRARPARRPGRRARYLGPHDSPRGPPRRARSALLSHAAQLSPLLRGRAPKEGVA